MLDTAALENHIGQQILFDHLQKTFFEKWRWEREEERESNNGNSAREREREGSDKERSK